jgi:hypothetical protein
MHCCTPAAHSKAYKYSPTDLLMCLLLPACLWLQLLLAQEKPPPLPNLDTLTIICGFNVLLGLYKESTASATSARLAPDQAAFDARVNTCRGAQQKLKGLGLVGRPAAAAPLAAAPPPPVLTACLPPAASLMVAAVAAAAPGLLTLTPWRRQHMWELTSHAKPARE